MPFLLDDLSSTAPWSRTYDGEYHSQGLPGSAALALRTTTLAKQARSSQVVSVLQLSASPAEPLLASSGAPVLLPPSNSAVAANDDRHVVAAWRRQAARHAAMASALRPDDGRASCAQATAEALQLTLACGAHVPFLEAAALVAEDRCGIRTVGLPSLSFSVHLGCRLIPRSNTGA
jgi:hypothetical protein